MSESLTEESFISLQKNLLDNQLIILKFTATWCVPCKNIKPICDEYVQKLPKSIAYFEIDIDESLDLYIKLKKYRMVNGIPALLAYKSDCKDLWYVPDDSQLGGDKQKVKDFFERCIYYVNN
tara:strand:+ start:309 stop:674 length:366 start_codon:yes stop_codon:yes gene_type:complete